ncbi:glycoside hydrolase family 15 protein [Halorussus amylolyticus]|uniref:glycoside hydrolase family 15 protein n=1 Tax=Halorussus amylolyticus TaxID=1126242 RepID=UPI001046C091|nr:glycoside hydrolase family 15 protein [Halorussus amylolyticus]
MKLRHALNDYKRHRDHDTKFPGERRSTTGVFSGTDGRLVHVSRTGALRDYSDPLVELSGIERSRFGVETDEVRWFAGASAQEYVGDSAVVETAHEFDDWTATQYDLTVGRAHVTRFELSGDPPDDARLRGVVGFAPDGREGQLANLLHENAVEVYHRDEHDYLGVSTDLRDVAGQVPERFDELVSPDPVAFPRATDAATYEEPTLSGTVGFAAPFEDGGVTVVSLLADSDERPRGAALSRVDDLLSRYDDASALRHRGDERALSVGENVPNRRAVTADLRALSLLSASSGARIAGPDFDPFYEHSGGYGYTWFRDDAEISRFLLTADRVLGLPIDDWHARSAAFYCDTQLEDGTWPHRVWPRSGALAPGWANARLEAGSDADYQADQTASVASFLATYLRQCDGENADAVETALERAVGALDATLADDGLPVASQNAWENMQGRFTHTAATFLHAYGAVARAPVEASLRDRARSQAETVLASLDRLWTGDHYALRLADGERDSRLDSSTLALGAAHREYAAVADLSDEKRDRLVAHVETTLDGLLRETGSVRGLARFEDDPWRRRSQDDPKIWTVSTAWGANAAAQLGTLLADLGDDRAARAYGRARGLLRELLPEGSLVQSSGYLPEQVFDDGTPDCATPLGWPHALRLATIAHLADVGELRAENAVVQTD